MDAYTHTSAQILEALAQERLAVSDTQLGRWYHEGLLIERERKGRGRGLGVDWYWGADTLDRARIIATTLQEKGATFEDAGKALLLNNYRIRAEKMRVCLISIVSDLEALHTRRQLYLTHSLPQAEKENRLKR